MFSNIKLFSFILVIIILFVLIAFSFMKYNHVNDDEYRQIVHNVEKGEKNFYNFLDYIKNIDWLNLDKKDIIEEDEKKAYELNVSEKVNFKKLINHSFSVIDWGAMWSNYWQKHLNWFNEEMESIKNK